MSRGGKRAGSGRPKGSVKPRTTRVTVRLTDAELAALDRIGPNRTKALKTAIASHRVDNFKL